MPASMREAQASDWLEDLREFGPEIVEHACREWRQKPGGRRPTPGDVRALCAVEQNRRTAERLARLPAAPKPPEPPPMTDAERRAMAEKLGSLAGMLAGKYRWPNGRQTAPLPEQEARTREYRPSPEDLRAGRIALGLEGE